MRLLDGLKGIDFAGIGDDPALDMTGVFAPNTDAPPGASSDPFNIEWVGAKGPVQVPATVSATEGSITSAIDNIMPMMSSSQIHAARAAYANNDLETTASIINNALPGINAQSVASTISTDAKKAGSDIASWLGISTSTKNTTPSIGIDVTGVRQEEANYNKNRASGSSGTQGNPMISAFYSIAADAQKALTSLQNTAAPATKAPPNTRPNVPGSFTSDFNAVVNGVLSIITPIAAAKQQKQQARTAAGPRGAAGSRGTKGPAGATSSSLNTYLIWGGGALVAGLLVYMVAKD